MASDRLYIYQSQFEVLYRKYVTCTSGEELFGLDVSQFPELINIKYAVPFLSYYF